MAAVSLTSKFFLILLQCFSSNVSTNSNCNSIWSPNLFENGSTTYNSDNNRSWNQMPVPTSNCYQNYSGYYSNMDYLNSCVQQQLVSSYKSIYTFCYQIMNLNNSFSMKMFQKMVGWSVRKIGFTTIHLGRFKKNKFLSYEEIYSTDKSKLWFNLDNLFQFPSTNDMMNTQKYFRLQDVN